MEDGKNYIRNMSNSPTGEKTMKTTIAKLTKTVTIAIGNTVTIHPIGADAGLPISGAIPRCDGPTEAVIIDAWVDHFSGPRVQVRLDAPGKSNHGRVLVLPHDGLTACDCGRLLNGRTYCWFCHCG